MSTNINNYFKNTSALKKKSNIPEYIIKIMDYWNIKPNVPSHSRMTTKVYKTSCDIIKRLQTGRLWKNKTICSTQLENYDKINKLRNRKFTQSEIHSILDSLSLLYNPEYWPRDKNHLPKSFPGLIYNPRSGYSFLMHILCNPPVKIKETEIKVNKTVLTYINFDYDSLREKDKIRFTSGIKTIKQYYCNIKPDPSGRFEYTYPDWISLFKGFILWLASIPIFQEHKLGYFDTGSKVWQMFIKEGIEDCLGFPLKFKK